MTNFAKYNAIDIKAFEQPNGIFLTVNDLDQLIKNIKREENDRIAKILKDKYYEFVNVWKLDFMTSELELILELIATIEGKQK